MSNLRTVVFGLAILSLAAEEVSAQSSWCRYKPRTLEAIIEQHVNTVGGPHSYATSYDQFPSRIELVYLGAKRPLSSRKNNFLDFYFTSIRTPDLADLFDQEVLFLEGEQKHWLVVQNEVIRGLDHEVPESTTVELFVLWLGAVVVDGAVDWVFIVNEFLSPASPEEWRAVLDACPGTAPEPRDVAVRWHLEITPPNQRLHLARATLGALALDSSIGRVRSRAGETRIR